MNKLSSFCFALGLAACSESASAPDAAPTEAPIIHESQTPVDTDAQALKTEMENGLTASVVFEDENVSTYSISERMAKFQTPAVSIAYAKDGQLVWADAYGEGVDENTQFQAASLSKAVAAAGIVAYALESGISLDEDVDALLPGVDLRSISPDDSLISLRGLLSHTAGATVGGFPGYAVGDTVPSNLGVILGGENTNTDAVIFNPNPDGEFRYSGGGFQIAQAVIEAQSGEPFEATVAERILTPVGMQLSSFAPRTPGGSTDGIATATNGDGSTVDGGWHIYPEQAAAGLWTTPSDYAAFISALMDSNQATQPPISNAVASEVLAPVSSAYGLGIGVEDVDGRVRIRHGGSNRGYRCFFVAFPDTREVFVLMTNSANGSTLGAEIIRAASKAYGWPNSDPKVIKRIELSENQMGEYAGAYALPGSTQPYATLTVGDRSLAGELAAGGLFSLVPMSETEFIDPDDGQEITFQADGDQMSLVAGGTTLTRLDSQ